MAQSYTDLAAQHAIARVETCRPLSPPPVPQGVPRFTSRGIAHQTKEDFPEYRQPEVTFIDGSDQVEMVDTDGSSAISSVSSRSQGSGGLSEHRWRTLLATPPRGPLTRLQSGQIVRETEEYEFVQESDVNQADIRPIELVRLNVESETDDPRFPADDSMDQETSQSLVPHSQNTDPDSSIAVSSQSILPRSLELRRGSPELDPKCGDLVVVFIRHQGRGRNRRPVTSMGVVVEVDSCNPLRVKTDRCPNKFHEVLDIKRRSTSMISNDTLSSSEDSISQPY